MFVLSSSFVIRHSSFVLGHWSDFLLDRSPWLLPALWLLFAFALGAAVGSFLNVCVARLPYEKSLLWPGSRCGSCFQPIRARDNIPLISYLVLRGRCRTCGARFSARYFFIELLTGLSFAGLFYLEVARNVHGLDPNGIQVARMDTLALPTWQAWVVFGYHAVLVCFLIVASFC